MAIAGRGFDWLGAAAVAGTIALLATISALPLGATLVRAVPVALALNGGLLLAPKARGWIRWLAGLAMVPGFAIWAGLAGEGVVALGRGDGLSSGAGLGSLLLLGYARRYLDLFRSVPVW